MQGKAGCSAEKGNFGKVGQGRSFKWRGRRERKNPNVHKYKDNFHTQKKQRQLQSYKDKYTITKKSTTLARARLEKKVIRVEMAGGGGPCLYFKFEIKS